MPAPIITDFVNGDRCNSGSVNIQVTSNGGSIRWFDALTGGNELGTSGSGTDWATPSISSTTVYYAEAYGPLGLFVSDSRTAVTATVNTSALGPGGITDELFFVA